MPHLVSTWHLSTTSSFHYKNSINW